MRCGSACDGALRGCSTHVLRGADSVLAHILMRSQARYYVYHGIRFAVPCSLQGNSPGTPTQKYRLTRTLARLRADKEKMIKNNSRCSSLGSPTQRCFNYRIKKLGSQRFPFELPRLPQGKLPGCQHSYSFPLEVSGSDTTDLNSVLLLCHGSQELKYLLSFLTFSCFESPWSWAWEVAAVAMFDVCGCQ